MIILAIGMPRAGSGWHYNLTHDLMMTAGARNAREIRQRYQLKSILTKVNCNIGALTVRRLLMVMIPSLLGNTFTIKVHAGPTPFALRLIQRGKIRATYIYRDPRDALLSAYDYGQRALEKGRPNAFSHLDSIEKAIEFMTEYVEDWSQWMACGHILPIRYETFKTEYDTEAKKLARFLGADPQIPTAQAVIAMFSPERAQAGDKGLHFNKGISNRFRQVLTAKQQQACLDAFGETLSKMGYEA